VIDAPFLAGAAVAVTGREQGPGVRHGAPAGRRTAKVQFYGDSVVRFAVASWHEDRA
jgi:hypothetical protein